MKKDLSKNENMPSFVALKLRQDAKIPTKRKEDSGYDLYAVWDERVVVHKPSEVMMFPTGLKMRFSTDKTALFRERGSTGIRNMQVRAGVVEGNFSGEYKILLSNGNTSKSIIYVHDDATVEEIAYAYAKSRGMKRFKEGEFSIQADKNGLDILYCSGVISDLAYIYPQSKAIAQMVVLNKNDNEFVEVDKKTFNSIPTERGEGMLGSSNK